MKDVTPYEERLLEVRPVSDSNYVQRELNPHVRLRGTAL
jgi:hypothetical protein